MSVTSFAQPAIVESDTLIGKGALADLERVLIMDLEYPEAVRLWADVLA